MHSKEYLRFCAGRIFVWLIAALAFLNLPTIARAAAGNTALKIYEVAGAGGLAGASYRQDTIILFNPTSASINCSTCAIQTHSGTSNTSTWTVYKLPTMTIPAGGFYMIAGSAPDLSTYGSLPPIAYDYRLKTLEGTTSSSDNILSSTVGEVALTNTQTVIASATTNLCGSGSQILDLVGYGSNFATNSATSATPSICYAGSGPAFYDGSSTTGRLMGVVRKNKCIDTYDNSNDWVNVPVVYYSSVTALSPCPSGSQLSATISATPNNPGVLESITFTAKVVKASNAGSATINAVVNFDSPYFNNTTQTLYDDGTHGDATAGDGIYTLATTIPSGVMPGFTYPTNITFNDGAGNTYIASTLLTIPTGTISITSSQTSGVLGAGGHLTFPITITGQHGYGGTMLLTCTGSPNANSTGVPANSICLFNPNEITIGTDGTATVNLSIAAGTTSLPNGFWTHNYYLNALVLLTILGCSLAMYRGRRLFSVLMICLAAIVTLGATACGTAGGLTGTTLAPGTYTYTATATDSSTSTVNNSISFTISVQ